MSGLARILEVLAHNTEEPDRKSKAVSYAHEYKDRCNELIQVVMKTLGADASTIS